MPLHPDKLAGLQRYSRQRRTTNPRPIAPIARPRPAAPRPGQRRDWQRRDFRTDARRDPNLDNQRRQVAQRQRLQQARPQPLQRQPVTAARQPLRKRAQAKLLEKEPREPGVPTLLQKLAYRMHQGRLNRHFMDLQERRKESGFRKV